MPRCILCDVCDTANSLYNTGLADPSSEKKSNNNFNYDPLLGGYLCARCSSKSDHFTPDREKK